MGKNSYYLVRTGRANPKFEQVNLPAITEAEMRAGYFMNEDRKFDDIFGAPQFLYNGKPRDRVPDLEGHNMKWLVSPELANLLETQAPGVLAYRDCEATLPCG